MRGYVPECEVQVPSTLAEALALMAVNAGRPLAGGTDLMVVFNAGRSPFDRFLDLSRLSELQGIEEDATHVSFGALTTFRDMEDCSAVHRHLPNLVKSARATGALAIQNRGTLGRNLPKSRPPPHHPPAPFATGGRTGGTEKAKIEIKQGAGKPIQLPAAAQLTDVVKALNALGATPQDLLAILQAIKSAGALNAELEVI